MLVLAHRMAIAVSMILPLKYLMWQHCLSEGHQVVQVMQLPLLWSSHPRQQLHLTPLAAAAAAAAEKVPPDPSTALMQPVPRILPKWSPVSIACTAQVFDPPLRALSRRPISQTALMVEIAYLWAEMGMKTKMKMKMKLEEGQHLHLRLLLFSNRRAVRLCRHLTPRRRPPGYRPV